MVIGSLVNDLLDLAKLDSSSFSLNNEYFNIIDSVTQTFQNTQFQAEQKYIKFILKFDETKPYMLSQVYSDQRRIQ